MTVGLFPLPEPQSAFAPIVDGEAEVGMAGPAAASRICSVEPCLVGLEACASAHHWANAIGQFGHTVRMMPSAYGKAYVKRNKTDAADAEAICEAVTRPTMRFVPIKSPEEQAAGWS